MTKQEIFDKVVSALIAQGEPSRDEDGYCRYRGPRGLKCAIGHLMSDESYNEGLEGLSVGTFISGERLVMKALGLPDEFSGLLDDLQVAHDRNLSCSMLSFLEQVKSIANKYGLNYG